MIDNIISCVLCLAILLPLYTNAQVWHVQEIGEIPNPFNPPQSKSPGAGYGTTMVNDDGVVIRLLPITNKRSSETQNIKITVFPPDSASTNQQNNPNVLSFVVSDQTPQQHDLINARASIQEQKTAAINRGRISTSNQQDSRQTLLNSQRTNNNRRPLWRRPQQPTPPEAPNLNRVFPWSRNFNSLSGLSLLNRFNTPSRSVVSPRNFRKTSSVSYKIDAPTQVIQKYPMSPESVQQSKRTLYSTHGGPYSEAFNNKNGSRAEISIDSYFPERRVILPRHDKPDYFASTRAFGDQNEPELPQTTPNESLREVLKIAPSAIDKTPIKRPGSVARRNRKPKPGKKVQKKPAPSVQGKNVRGAEKKSRSDQIKRQKGCGLPPFYKPCLSKQEVNQFALECCQNNGDIPQSCHRLCNVEVTPAQLWAADRAKTCPSKTIKPFLSCVAENEDLRPCCASKGVPAQCHTFCFPSTFTGFNMSQLRCLPFWNQIVSCFWGNADPK